VRFAKKILAEDINFKAAISLLAASPSYGVEPTKAPIELEGPLLFLLVLVYTGAEWWIPANRLKTVQIALENDVDYSTPYYCSSRAGARYLTDVR
ncbi:hypothetical protein FOZ63_028270, partial [Perkinsus olseni]